MKCECGTEAGVGHGIFLERRDSRHHSGSRAYVASTCPANKQIRFESSLHFSILQRATCQQEGRCERRTGEPV
jgi:hypothetical protein